MQNTFIFVFGGPILVDLWENVSVAGPYWFILGGMKKKMRNIKNKNF